MFQHHQIHVQYPPLPYPTAELATPYPSYFQPYYPGYNLAALAHQFTYYQDTSYQSGPRESCCQEAAIQAIVNQRLPYPENPATNLPYPSNAPLPGQGALPYPVDGAVGYPQPRPSVLTWEPMAKPGVPYPTEDLVTLQVKAYQQAASSAPKGDLLSGSANVLPSAVSLKARTKTYAEIRAEVSKTKRLWEDPDFPANNYSISAYRKPSRPIEWKRPGELVSNPEFIDRDGMSRFDIVQGELGDCWLLAAIANLTLNPVLIAKVVPKDQTFAKGDYCGAFRFNFWLYGHWEEVVVDDKLPTYNGRLVYMHSAARNEFWSALLEKAYAKIVGSYDNLRGGSTCESMTDLTGGFCEIFELRDKTPKILLQALQKALERGSLMCCSINQQENMPSMATLQNGLIMGHAYSVTDLKKISWKSGDLILVRVRNPWGQTEWNGAFSDNSPLWSQVTESERRKIGQTSAADGEFWMTYQDFTANFELLELCNLSFDLIGTREQLEANQKSVERHRSKKWETTIIEGEWRRHFNAGGCRNFIQSFATNPQYRIRLTEYDEHDPEKLCTVLIGLLQKDRRKVKAEMPSFLTIGFSIYKLTEADCQRPLDQNWFQANVSKARSSFINLREVSGRFRLPPGTYAIIPSTYEPGTEGEFVLRIYSEKKCSANEIDEITSIVQPKPIPVAKTSTATLNESEIRAKAIEAYKVVAGADGVVDATELQAALSKKFQQEFKFQGFNLETARSMIALKDKNLYGTVDLYEFIDLYQDVTYWSRIFLQFDPKKTGTMEASRLREALKQIGYGLSNKVFRALVVRYSDRKGLISFDDFVNCAIRLASMLQKFKLASNVKDSTPRASFLLEDFILTTMYC